MNKKIFTTIIVVLMALGVRSQEIKHIEKDTIHHIEEITISSNREQTLRSQASSLIDITTPKTMAATNAVCIAQTLDFVSGVRVEDNCQNCGFTQVRINGLDGHYSQILIDSKPIFSSLNGIYGLEQIPAEMIDRIEVMRGGGSALYGSSAVGGIINIITKEASTNSGGFGHSFTNHNLKKSFDNTTHLYASAVNKKRNAGLYVFGQMRYRDAYDHNGDEYSDIPKLRNIALGVNAYIRPTRLSKLSFRYNFISDEHRGGNKLDLAPHLANISEGASHRIHGGNIDYHIDFGQNHFEIYSALQFINRDSYYGGIGADNEWLDYEEALKMYGYTKNLTISTGALWRRKFDKMLFMPASLTIGAEYDFDHLTDSIPGYEQYLLQNVHIGAVYAQNEWKNDKLSFLIGVRTDKHSLIRRPIFSPRVNIRYNPLRKLSLRASYGSGFRAPQTYDEDLHVSLANGERIISTISDDLKEERSHSTSLSLDYCAFKRNVDLDFTAEIFYTYLKDIFAERRFENPDGSEISERYNADKGFVAGFHGAVKIGWSRWINAQIGATWQQSRYNKPLEWNEDAEPEIRMLRTPDVYGYLIIETNPWKSLKLNMSSNFTGPMLTPHETETPHLVKTPAFLTLNAQISYDFKIMMPQKSFADDFKAIHIILTAGIKNITNSYQNDLDVGYLRDSGYIYGPKVPRSFYFGITLNG